MTYSFRIEKIGIGESQVPFEQLLPSHQKTIHSCLVNNFFKKPEVSSYFASQGKSAQFDFSLGQNEVTLAIQGKKGSRIFTLKDSQEMKQVFQAARYYLNMGCLGPVPKGSPIDANPETTRAVQQMKEGAVPSATGKILTGVKIGENGLSLTRNILSALPKVGSDASFVAKSGFAVGSVWSFLAVKELYDGGKEYETAERIGDLEGVRRARAQIVSGAGGTAAAASYLSGKISLAAGAATLGSTYILMASTLFGLGSLMGIGMSALGMLRCYRFQNRLDEYLCNPKHTEAERLQGALRFLKDQLSISPEEKRGLIEKIEKEHPQANQAERQKRLEIELLNKAEAKTKHLKRRTSNLSVQLIYEKTDALLEQLAQGQGISEARELVDTVMNESEQKLSLFGLGAIASILGFAGFLCANVFSLGTLSFILFGLAGLLYLSLAIYHLILGYLNKDSEVQGINLDPLSVPVRL